MGSRIKVGFDLLQMRLASCPLLIAAGDQWADGEFGQGHGGDEGLGGQDGGIGQAWQQDDRGSIQHAAGSL